MAFWDRITGGVVGIAVGTAAADAVSPVLEVERQLAWASRAVKVVGPTLAAEAAARGIPTNVNLSDDAKRGGVGGARFDLLTKLAYRFPGASDLIRLRRRGLISDNDMSAALYRQSMPEPWVGRLLNLQHERLSPADVANAIQQAFVPNDGYLPPQASGGQPFDIPTITYPIPPADEFAAAGFDAERGRVLAELAGLPPGVETLLEMWRRSIITEGSVDAGIREGHTKSKWIPALKALRFQLLSAATLVNLRLRGWIEDAEYHDRMRVHGYGAAEADDWFRSAGRPMAPVQAFTAFFRGARSPRDTSRPFDRQDFDDAIRRSDIRPEYNTPLWDIRHAYPSLFQLRRAVQEGSIGTGRALTILRYERYEDTDAQALVASWTAGSAAGPKGLTATDLAAEYEGFYISRDEYVSDLEGMGFGAAQASAKADAIDARRTRQARNRAIEAIRKRYGVHRASQDETRAALDGLNLPAEAINLLLTFWTYERDEKVAILTPAQVKKAYGKNIIDRTAALDELADRGYNATDAVIFLDE